MTTTQTDRFSGTASIDATYRFTGTPGVDRTDRFSGVPGGRLLLSGDMQSGIDGLLLSGDMTDGDDEELLSGDEAASVSVTYRLP